MSSIIGGISRVFRPTIGILSAEKLCQGINPWFFLIGLRIVTLFFAFGPWDSLKKDLVCQWPSDVGDEKTFCSALCYSQQFPIPISSAWTFYFIAIMFTVALMKLVYFPEKSPSEKDAEASVEPKPAPGTNRCCELTGQTKFGSWRYGIYIFCIVLILVIELLFIWTLLGLQLPVMNQGIITCRPNNPACPPSAQCALNGRSDKRNALWVLAFCAAANASVAIGYLATHCGQSCGFCGGSGAGGTARTAGQGNSSRQAVGGGCRCDGAGCNYCQGGSGEWAGAYGYRCGGMGMGGCQCQSEGGNCCCCQGSDTGKEAACGCHGNRHCPCSFQGSEVGQSRNSVVNTEDSEGKLQRGDIEQGGERKQWRPTGGRLQVSEPLRTGPRKGRGGSPARGRAVKYMAKYHVWGKRKV